MPVMFAGPSWSAVKRQFSFVALVLLTLPSAQAAPWMEDAITNAAVGSNIGSAAPWGNSSSQVKVASGSLSYTGLADLSLAGNAASIAGTGGGSSYRPFNSSAVSGGVVYYSFLVRCTSLPTGGGYLTGLLPSGTTSPGGSSDPLAVYAALSDWATNSASARQGSRPPTPRPSLQPMRPAW